MASQNVDWAQSCITEHPSLPWPNNNNRLRDFRKLWSSQRLWRIQGDALDAYLSVDTAIHNALQKYDILHEGCRFYPQTLEIRCYMVGSRPGNARPCIFIFCQDKTALARSREAVMRNQELQALRVQYPGCFNVQPVLGKPAVYLGREFAKDVEGTEVFYDPASLQTIYGAPIRFKRSQRWIPGIFGGFVVIKDEICGLTVVHPAIDSQEDLQEGDLENNKTAELSSSDLELLFPPLDEDSRSTAFEDESYHRPSFDADSGVSMVSAMSISSTSNLENYESILPEYNGNGEAVDESRLEVLGHFDQLQTSTEDASHWALIKITSTTFLSHFERQTLGNLARPEHLLHMRLGTTPKPRESIPSDVFLWISDEEHPGFLDQCPTLVRLPGYQNLTRLREVTVPSLSFRKSQKVYLERCSTD